MLGQLVEEWIEYCNREDPIMASMHGFDGYDDKMPDFSPERFDSRLKKLKGFEERLQAVKPKSLDEEIDMLLMEDEFYKEKLSLQLARNSPITSISSVFNSIDVIYSYMTDSEEDVMNLIARIENIPAVLKQSYENLDRWSAGTDRIALAGMFCEETINQLRIVTEDITKRYGRIVHALVRIQKSKHKIKSDWIEKYAECRFADPTLVRCLKTVSREMTQQKKKRLGHEIANATEMIRRFKANTEYAIQSIHDYNGYVNSLRLPWYIAWFKRFKRSSQGSEKVGAEKLDEILDKKYHVGLKADEVLKEVEDDISRIKEEMVFIYCTYLKAKGLPADGNLFSQAIEYIKEMKQARRIVKPKAADPSDKAKQMANEKHTNRFAKFFDAAMQRIMNFAAGKLVDVPTAKSLLVVKTPEYLVGQIPTAAYLGPKKFKRTRYGVYNITLGRDIDTVETLFSLVHETGGHHTQSIYKREQSIFRERCEDDMNREGWAMYVEKLFAENGFFKTTYEKLIQKQYELLRAIRARTHIMFHTDQAYSIKDAENEFMEAGFTTADEYGQTVAFKESRRVNSGVVLAYYLGMKEMFRIRENYIQQNHPGQEPTQAMLKEFHNRFLSYGCMPLHLIKKMMTQD